MKCPRCNFISFDYNQKCPKCGNDLSQERDHMNFPPYQPKPLSLLGLLTSHEDRLAAGATLEGLDAPRGLDSDVHELLISLDSLSDEAQEPIQFEPEPFVPEPQPLMEKKAVAADMDLDISLDDFIDADQEPIRHEPAPSEKPEEAKPEEKDHEEGWPIPLEDLSDERPGDLVLEPGPERLLPDREIGDDAFFETQKDTRITDQPQEVDFWKNEALAQRMADIQRDRSIDADDQAVGSGEPARKEEAAEPELWELELEPLELTLEMEEPDKKTP